MFEQVCVVCKGDIVAHMEPIHLMDEHGFTHHYCHKCGQDVKERLNQRDKSIKGR